MSFLVRPLFSGPIDIIGDVHGGLKHLHSLVEKLGYDESGCHPNRRLVFLGDIVDRGEDSPGVLALVQRLVLEKRAQCVLGNHELNILLQKEKPGSEWFYRRSQYLENPSHLLPQKQLSPSQRTEALRFFSSLPLVLERKDLRVVHACWNTKSVHELRTQQNAVQFLRNCNKQNKAEILATEDRVRRALIDQNENPVKVVTSGLEQRRDGPSFIAGGSPRRTERVPWWNTYTDRQSVVFGHYWHSQAPLERFSGIPSPFRHQDHPLAPLGPRRNAWCVDFSNGHRSEEAIRRPWRPQPVACLAALRWPEQEIVLA
ncbi:MAG TPA: metallophosphoesterase [Planctomycetota bacterium]|nr:hypothetical protein [Planctomycetota bacterium]HJM40526.1 metallophosphoesterase [Planctomycetota bacterium]